ncbi:MAG: hypothetical protein GDA42_09705 [Ekhidna sp.]|nr:hypothetical protein [Ekhidna sp.]
MKLNLLNLSALALLEIVILSSCVAGASGEQEISSDAGSEFESAKKQVAVNVAKVLEDLPPPSEIPYLLLQAGVDFNPAVINDISAEKIASYQPDESKAALNLGVYATDICYLASYEKSEIALNYIGECQKLAAPVGIADAIDYGIVARFESNMENKDSLSVIVNETMAKSGERLSELDEFNNAALLLAGSWIEGIYISTQIVDTYPVDLPEAAGNLVLAELVKVIIDQKKSLNDLIKVMSNASHSEDVSAMITELEKIKVIYDEELTEVTTQIAENTGRFVLETSTLEKLAAEVKRLRTSIIE